MTILGVDITAHLPELRRQAESNMTSVCTIERRTGGVSVDPDTLIEAPEWAAHLAGVPCRAMRGGRGRPGEIQTGGQYLTEVLYEVAVPVSYTDVRQGDRLRFTSSDDPALLSVVLYVRGTFHGSQIVERRFYATEDQG